MLSIWLGTQSLINLKVCSMCQLFLQRWRFYISAHQGWGQLYNVNVINYNYSYMEICQLQLYLQLKSIVINYNYNYIFIH